MPKVKHQQAVCFFIHANLQYAEIPSSEIPNVVKKSYIPTLDIFIKNPFAKAVMDFSGVTLEILARDYPKVIDKLRQLISQGSVELIGGTYAHPILPLIPLDHAKKQIEMFLNIYNQLFGDLKIKLKGFIPPEYFFDASLIPLLEEFGFEWLPVNSIQYINSLSHRFNNPLKSPLRQNELEIREYHQSNLFNSINILGAENSTMSGLIISGEFYELVHDLSAGKMSFEEYFRLLDDLARTHNNDGNSFLFLGPSDMEFIGSFAPVYANKGHQTIPPEWLEQFSLKLLEDRNLVFRTGSEHLEKYPPQKGLYLKCGGDAVDLDFWAKDPDNVRLNLLCQDATRTIEHAQMKLEILKSQGKDTSQLEKQLTEAWQALMLSENADGRGWMPIPERRLFCYNQALLSLKKARQIIES